MNPGWRGERFYRGVVDGPTVLILAAALGLWRLWPTAAAVEKRVVRPSRGGSRVELVSTAAAERWLHLSPDLFGRPSRVGFSRAEAPASAATEFAGRPVPVPRFLEAVPQTALTNLPAVSESLAALAAARMGAYRAFWEPDPVFPRPASEEGTRLSIQVSGALADRGFQVASWPGAAAELSEKPWMAVLSVSVDERGRPEQVFLETGSGKPALDLLVVKGVERGAAVRPGPACSGRVIVNFGNR